MSAIKALCATLFLAVLACGGSSTAPGTSSCSGPLSATVNGAAWCSPGPSARYQDSLLSISGFDATITSNITLVVMAPAPGTYSVTFANAVFGLANYVKGTQSWSTGVTGGTGSVTITTLTANHVVGTFSFSAVPAGGGATGTAQITNGQFNITN